MNNARGPVINVADVTGFPVRGPEPVGAVTAPLGPRIGADRLACMLTVVEPGHVASRLHAHSASEEIFVVLEGEGTVRIGDATHAIRAGDVISCRPGGAAAAHQMANTGVSALRYIAIATASLDPDEVVYPDGASVGTEGRA